MRAYSTLLAVLFCISNVYSLPAVQKEPTDRIWPIPQYDGSIRYMTREQAIIEALLLEPLAETRKLDKIRFFLYTPKNPEVPQVIDMDDPETLFRSFFNRRNPTRFMIHGWNGDYNFGNIIRKALLQEGKVRNYNYFAVDWSVYGASLTYVTSQSSVSKAGKTVAEFIDWLHLHTKLSFDNLAIYGHSLGAHVAGFTGKYLQNGQIHTIVGLDPAMPLFSYNNPKTRLADTDGSYVETIQTNGGILGFYNPIGKAAFYPNGGQSQPGCGLDLTGSCSHGRPIRFLAEAIRLEDNNGFDVVQCSQFEDVKTGNCTIEVDGIRLGHPDNAGKASGIYYLKTNRASPYGLNVNNKI